MEIERYDNLFFPRSPGKTLTVKEKLIVINELIINNLWQMGNFREKHETTGGTQVRRNRQVTNRGSLLVEWRKKGGAIRRLTGGGKKTIKIVAGKRQQQWDTAAACQLY